MLDNISTAVTSKLTRANDQPVDSGVTIYDVLTYYCNYSDPVIIGNTPTVEVIPGLEVTGVLVEKL